MMIPIPFVGKCRTDRTAVLPLPPLPEALTVGDFWLPPEFLQNATDALRFNRVEVRCFDLQCSGRNVVCGDPRHVRS